MTYIETILTIIAICGVARLFMSVPAFLHDQRRMRRIIDGIDDWDDGLVVMEEEDE